MLKDRIKELRRVKASELLPNVKNWRKHPEAQRNAMQGVLAEIGIADALVAREHPDGTLELLDGHLRQDLDPDQEWPVLILDVDDAEADTILATLDPLAAMARTDEAQLEELLAELQTDDDQLQKLLDSLARDAGIDFGVEIVEDDVPDVPDAPAEPITQTGDLWLLGEHRLLCGDATNAEDVGRLMDGSKVRCVFTDPPYGVSIGAKNRLLNSVPKAGRKAGRNSTDIKDDMLTPEGLKAQLLPAFENLRKQIMAVDCTLFVTAPQSGELCMMMMMMMRDAKLPVRHVLIWKKNQPTFSLGRLDYDYAHEPILLTWGKKHLRPMNGQHRTSVWEIDRPRKSAEHPTMKPVELYANAYLNNSEMGDCVADTYAGSGTAFIAAEQIGRTCYGLEISPQYCDVIVARWEQFTGQQAKRIPATTEAPLPA